MWGVIYMSNKERDMGTTFAVVWEVRYIRKEDNLHEKINKLGKVAT
jgi:hypothetical protein